MIAKHAGTPVVARNFLAYLEQRLQVKQLYFAEKPLQIPDGWETYIFRFRLGSRTPLPAKWRRRLILRIHPSTQGLAHLRHEHDVQVHMKQLGYPAAPPLLLDESPALYDGPFLIMEWLPGRPL